MGSIVKSTKTGAFSALFCIIFTIFADFFAERIYNSFGGRSKMKYSTYFVVQLKDKPGKPWQARLKYKENGKWRETSKILKDVKGKREAQKLALEWFNSMNETASTEPAGKDKTVGEAIMDYLEYQSTSGLIEQTTYTTQKGQIDKMILPYLSDYDFKTLDRTAIIKWHTALLKKGYAQSSVSLATRILAKVYSYSVFIGELDRNPFNQIKRQQPKIRITHLSEEQATKYLAAVYADFGPEDWMFAACLLAYYAGLRRGEILGLRWRDINFEANTLSVASSIGMKEGGKYLKNPKSKSSIRTFPMVSQLADALLERYDILNPRLSDFVVSKNGDEPMSPITLDAYFKRFRNRNELIDIYGNPLILHSLRHHLGFIGAKSIDISSLSHMLGHNNRAITLNVYGDSDTDAMILASNKLGEAFKKTDLDT